MNYAVLESELRRVYAAHGKPPTGAILGEVAARVADMPDLFLQQVFKDLKDLPKLPDNLGRHIELDMFPAWKMARRAVDGEHRCPECSRDTPGWFYGWKGKGYEYIIRCACRGCGGMTREQARREGYLVTPLGYPGGDLAFHLHEVLGISRNEQPSPSLAAFRAKFQRFMAKRKERGQGVTSAVLQDGDECPF